MGIVKQVDQYLENYAEPSSRLAPLLFNNLHLRYDHVLVIPVFDETDEFLHNYCASHANSNSLLVVVLNYPDNAVDSPAAKRTRIFGDELLNNSLQIDSCEHLHLIEACRPLKKLSVLLVDHAHDSSCLNAKHGVGLARKIGGDIALALIRRDIVSIPWIYFSDADATLPSNYYQSSLKSDTSAAIHFNFNHTNPSGVSLAQKLYDLTLDYYVAGLTFANSRYSHYSLGSAITVNAKHYAMVRGMPKRAAGEDFYLLNKLAKTGDIRFDQDITIDIKERHSLRVPFGTGPATAKIETLENPKNDYCYYHPDCFEYLKSWLHLSNQLLALPREFNYKSEKRLFIEDVSRLDQGTVLIAALRKLGAVDQLFEILCHYGSERQRRFHMTTNFDALKTLRLIHQLRDLGFGECSAQEVLTWFKKHSLPSPRSTSTPNFNN